MANHLQRFFARYPSFPFDPFAPANIQFGDLRCHFGWGREDEEWQRAKCDYKDALVHEFNQIYGTNENDIQSWHALCRVLGLYPIPQGLNACREEKVESVNVNLVDLVDMPQNVRLFATEKKLSEYTLENCKFFPKENAHAGGLLKYLLRHIMSPSEVPRGQRKNRIRRGWSNGIGRSQEWHECDKDEIEDVDGEAILSLPTPPPPLQRRSLGSSSIIDSNAEEEDKCVVIGPPRKKRRLFLDRPTDHSSQGIPSPQPAQQVPAGRVLRSTSGESEVFMGVAQAFPGASNGPSNNPSQRALPRGNFVATARPSSSAHHSSSGACSSIEDASSSPMSASLQPKSPPYTSSMPTIHAQEDDTTTSIPPVPAHNPDPQERPAWLGVGAYCRMSEKELATNAKQVGSRARLVGIQIGLKQQELDKLKKEEQAITRALARQQQELEELRTEEHGLKSALAAKRL